METNPAPRKVKLNVSLDLRIVIVVLLVAIAAMLVIWKPWSGTGTSNRTVEVTGEASLTAAPDEFVFYPSYEFKNADKEAALAAMTEKSDEVTAKLKELGVDESDIKTNASGYDYPVFRDDTSDEVTYTAQVTVKVGTLALAQKVQDYLTTTTPTGAVTPQADFSDQKRKELEAKARDEATKDARAKADQSAENLGFTVGRVKSINDGAGFGGSIPFLGRGAAEATDSAASKTQLTIQPGENELSYSVTVVYFIR